MSENTFKFTITGVEKATGAMLAAIETGSRSGMETVGLRGEALVKQFSPVATANLVNSIQEDLQGGKGFLRAVVFAGPPADVYALPVETGTRPHRPPIGALVLWVKAKLHVDDEKKAVSIAWAIAKTIEKRGTKGAFMFQQAFDALEGEVQPILEQAIAAAIQEAGLAA